MTSSFVCTVSAMSGPSSRSASQAARASQRVSAGQGARLSSQCEAASTLAASAKAGPTPPLTVARASSPHSPSPTAAGDGDADSWPCKKTWCRGERRQHLLLCVTSLKYFGNPYTHICSRPEIWLMKKADPWARDEETGEVVALEPEPLPPPSRVEEEGYDGLTEEEKAMVDPELLVDPEEEEDEHDN